MKKCLFLFGKLLVDFLKQVAVTTCSLIVVGAIIEKVVKPYVERKTQKNVVQFFH